MNTVLDYLAEYDEISDEELQELLSIEKICDGLGITLAQFFSDSEPAYLTAEQKEILDLWGKLSPKQRAVVLEMLKSFVE